MVGETLDRMESRDMLVVMSDHGFASWRRTFHLNSWLEQTDYLALKDPDDRTSSLLGNVDWSRTRAYGLGLNGLYINLAGREQHGIVSDRARDSLVREIAAKLLQVIDPKTGQPAITKVYNRDQVLDRVTQPSLAPDLIVGYAKGTRVSSQSAIGAVPAEVMVDNLDEWSGDHCMDHDAVPGILLSSRPLRRRASTLQELASALLAEFSIPAFPAQDR